MLLQNLFACIFCEFIIIFMTFFKKNFYSIIKSHKNLHLSLIPNKIFVVVILLSPQNVWDLHKINIITKLCMNKPVEGSEAFKSKVKLELPPHKKR